MYRTPPAGAPLILQPSPPLPPRGLTRRWRYRQPQAATLAPGESLVQRVLRARGVTEPALAAAFLEPRLTGLHDPSLIPDLDRAAARLLAALDAREPIAIYGDYDVDGVTASAILWHVMAALRPDAPVSTYVPHRVDEGYGINSAAIAALADQGVKVVVSVDCGVTAVDPAAVARRRGIDLIITDHHNPPASLADLPDAYAVVHPRRPDSAYPFGDLSGAGVAYKLAWRLATLAAGSSKVAPDVRALLVDLLAFAALGAIADIVPLLDENRVLARHGLARIRSGRFRGLRELVRAARLESQEISAWDVGFRLGPRLNACGRLAHARDAVELFTSASAERAADIAADLEMHNRDRREIEQAIFASACERIVRDGLDSADRRAIVLADPQWHQGVVGIVCSRLVERFCRPAILLRSESGRCHGSARSIDGFNLHAALQRCAPLLEKFGGHNMAAGLALRESDLPAFASAFTAVANEEIAVERLVREATVDAPALLSELTLEAVRELERLEPHGPGNPPVRLALHACTIAANPTPLGKGGEHLSMLLRQEPSPRCVRVVAWKWAEHRGALHAGMRVDALVRPQISRYSGEAVELELTDLACPE